MQDFTGVPAVVISRRCAMPCRRSAATPRRSIAGAGRSRHRPRVIVNFFATTRRSPRNVVEEYKQNQERYEFLKWGQKAFSNFSWCRPAPVSAIRSIRILAQTVWTRRRR